MMRKILNVWKWNHPRSNLSDDIFLPPEIYLPVSMSLFDAISRISLIFNNKKDHWKCTHNNRTKISFFAFCWRSAYPLVYNNHTTCSFILELTLCMFRPLCSCNPWIGKKDSFFILSLLNICLLYCICVSWRVDEEFYLFCQWMKSKVIK